MQIVDVKIKGDQLMVDRYPVEGEQTKSIKRVNKNESPPEMALYRNGDGNYVPNTWIRKACLLASKQFKEAGRRGASYKNSFSAGVRIVPVCITLTPQEWTLFRRPLKRKDGQTIMKSSPLFTDWSLEFEMQVEDWLDIEQMKQILVEAGRAQGIGLWRPNCGGEYGRFTVEKFKIGLGSVQ